MADVVGPCPFCDAPSGVECDARCFGRMSDADASAYLRSFVALGRSIRRFVRRAEVRQLQSTIFDAFDHGPLCIPSVCVCSLAEWTEALDRLAALAMEVE